MIRLVKFYLNSFGMVAVPWLRVADGNDSVVLAIQLNNVTMNATKQTGASNLK